MITGQKLVQLLALDATTLSMQDLINFAENCCDDLDTQLTVAGYPSQQAAVQVLEVLDVLEIPSWEVTQYLKRGCKDFGKKHSLLDADSIELLLSQCRETRNKADRASDRSRQLYRETSAMKRPFV